MKEINGKIKFIVIPITQDFEFARITSKNELRAKICIKWQYICDVFPTSHIVGKLSEITEEQAAEFVEEQNNIGLYPSYSKSIDFNKKTAKESLIFLLKANDVWIKDWIYIPDGNCWSISNSDYMDKADKSIRKENAPDDLLLIKL